MKHVRNLVLSISILFSQRLRAALSVLGVAVGVAAMILIASIGDGVTKELQAAFESMGTDILLVRSKKFHPLGGRPRQVASVTTLSRKDGQAIAEACPDCTLVAASITRPQQIKVGAVVTNTEVESLGSEGFEVKGITAASGDLFTSQDAGARRAVIVLGTTVAEALFPEGDPVGELVSLGRLPFQVIGVAESKGSDAAGNDLDNIAFIPLDTGMRRVFHTNWIETLYVKVPDRDAMGAAETSVRGLLRSRHRLGSEVDDDFEIQNQAELLDAELEITAATTGLITGVGAITLVVAGIGILAVMLMSVRERRWEIGLRRAVGARREDILVQFLAEAALLSLAGALAGIIAGAALVQLVSDIGWAPAIFNMDAAMISSGVSVAIGLVFGIYPARRAAAQEPVAALCTRE